MRLAVIFLPAFLACALLSFYHLSTARAARGARGGANQRRESLPLVPAKAGTQPSALDSRFRGNERSCRHVLLRGNNALELLLGELDLLHIGVPQALRHRSKGEMNEGKSHPGRDGRSKSLLHPFSPRAAGWKCESRPPVS